MSACVPTRHDHSSRSSHPSRSSGVKRPHSPPPPRRGGRFRISGADVSASITVFLLAIPMSLGLAVAMGAPLEAGLISAAVGGIVAGLLGGTPLQVSGPSAGLTVVTAETIQIYGWRTTCAITIGAGLLQLALGSLRAARSALAVSPAIVHGTLAGIGVAIALAQLHIVLGGSPQSSAISNVLHLPDQLARVSLAAPLIGALTVAVLVLWPLLPGRTGRFLRRAPAALASVGLATAVAAWAAPSIARVDLPSWRSHALPEMPHGPVLGLATAVFTMMLVASLESLLAAVAVDKLAADRSRAHSTDSPARHGGAPGHEVDKTRESVDHSDATKRPAPPLLKRSDLDRELRAQGVANAVSGLLGGLAVSGGAVRSSANVRAGATGRASTVLHGVWILVASALLVGVLERIPLAALGALVMMVGLKMVSLAHIRNVHKHREFLVYGATIAGVLVVGVLKGVVIGIAVAVAVALHRLGRTRISVSEQNGQHLVVVRGQLTFLAVPRLSRVLGRLPQDADVVVELDGSFMDHAAYETIQDWSSAHAAQGGQVAFAGRFGGRIAEPAAAAHSCCRPWTPWRNHHCHDRPEHAPPPETHGSTYARATEAPQHAASTPDTVHPPSTALTTDSAGTARSADSALTAEGASTATAVPTGIATATSPTPVSPTPTPTPASAPPHAATAPSAGNGSLTASEPIPPLTQPPLPSRMQTSAPDAPATSAQQPAYTGRDRPPHSVRDHRLVRGLSSFQRDTAPLVRGELARLAREGQSPSQLFITCADSRLVTSMITASGPGDLFTVRNIGNLVPPPDAEGDHSVGAAIEYAVDVLGVESITVCGHSDCGAMNALLGAAPKAPDTSLWRWLRHGLPSLARVDAAGDAPVRLSGRLPADAVEQLCLTNVVQQLDHLRAHPSVAHRIADGTLQLHGMYFHVAEAQSYLLDEGASAECGTAEVFDPIAPSHPVTPPHPIPPAHPVPPSHPVSPAEPARTGA
ncbi:bifunctional SulP family inorganic anion transporter/carbonic anhydrase [Streptomyces sp. NPDC001665]